MEIHVSSLNYSSLRVNPQTAGQPDTVQNQPEKNQPDSNKLLQASKTANQTPEEIERLLADAEVSSLATFNADRTENPINTRLANAINAYMTTLNQPMQDRRSQLLAGIDLYV